MDLSRFFSRSFLPLTLVSAILTSATASAGEFRVSSPDLASGFAAEQVFSGFGCTGGNVSPALEWTGAPKGTKSFVLTVYDPDAPTGSGWWHWVVANIPASATGIAHGASGKVDLMPTGAREIANDGGIRGWMGPCPPPSRIHRYQVTVTAVSVDAFDLPENPSPALVGFLTNAAALGRASLTVRYGR